MEGPRQRGAGPLRVDAGEELARAAPTALGLSEPETRVRASAVATGGDVPARRPPPPGGVALSLLVLMLMLGGLLWAQQRPSRVDAGDGDDEASADADDAAAAATPPRPTSLLFSRNASSYQLPPGRCINTVQGRELVTDTRGQVCRRVDVLDTGCCDPGKTLGSNSCRSCRRDIECCTVYEFCVSCCMGLNAEEMLAPLNNFDRCAHLCRTSSRSLLHGNRYRNSVFRHCFVEESKPPPSTLDIRDTLTLAAEPGVSCGVACARRGMACHESFVRRVNDCDALRRYFPCEAGCEAAEAPELPAYMDAAAPVPLRPRMCLASKVDTMVECDSFHPHARRLCVCLPLPAIT